jgi:hypothetical protein
MGPTGWVVLRDYHELLGYDAKKVRAAVTAGGAQAMVQMQEKTAELLVKNWSREDLLLPATPAVTDRLTAAEWGGLCRAVQPALNLILGVGIKPVMSQEAMADPASPSGPSSE